MTRREARLASALMLAIAFLLGMGTGIAICLGIAAS